MTILGLFMNNEMRTGANRRYLELMESLAEKGNWVFVIMNSSLTYSPLFFARIDLDVLYTRGGFPPASSLFNTAVRRNISLILSTVGARADWIHIHGDTHLKAALYLKKATGAKFFFAFRCNDIDRAKIVRKLGGLNPKETILSFIYEAISRFREKIVARRAELVTFQNTDDRARFCARTGFLPGRTVIIPGNIGLPRFTPEWDNANTAGVALHLVYVGVLAVSKGLGYLLEALAQVKKDGFAEITLSVLGTVKKNDPALDLVRELGISDMVKFEGYALPFPFLAECGLMIYPTLYDAFPDAVLEALHTGCPVLASDSGGLRDMLGSDELLFESGNVREIADRIEKCVREPDFYAHIRQLCSARKKMFIFDWAERFIDAMNAEKKISKRKQ